MSSAPVGDSFLRYSLDGEAFEVHLQRPKIVIGRATDCDISILRSGVSRRHAVVFLNDDTWFVQDLESSNGTFVNGKSIRQYRLTDGDVIRIGVEEIEFKTLEAREEEGCATDGLLFLDEEESDTTLTSYIALGELDRYIEAPKGSASLVGLPLARTAEGPLSSASQEKRQDADLLKRGAWSLHVFSRAAKALLSSTRLDEILEKMMDLVFESLPAERGLIGIYDEAADTVRPVVTRSRKGSTQELRISRSIANEAIRSHNAVLVRDTSQDKRFSQEQSIALLEIRSAMCAPLYHKGRLEGLIYVDTRSFKRPFSGQDLEVLTTLAVLIAVGVEQTRLRKVILREQEMRTRLARYASPRVVDRIILDSLVAGEMIVEEREASILFADLSGFTTLSEKMAPTEVTRVLNSIYERLTKLVFDHDGTLDKFMGDGLMVIFGAPLPQPDHAARAGRVALLMQRELMRFNKEDEDAPPVRMRIGINSGPVVAGDIGSPQRKDYTVIGDTVNVASRLESYVAKPGQVVIGPKTYDLVRHFFRCEPLPETALKGRQHLVRPYLLVAPNS